MIDDVSPGATVMGVPAKILIPGSGARPEPSRKPCHAPGRPIDPELERAIAGIWAELLDLSSVPPDANFFDLGGRSVHALMIPEKLQQATGRTVQIPEVFQFPTLRSLARHLTVTAGDRSPTRVASRAAIRATIRQRLRDGH